MTIETYEVIEPIASEEEDLEVGTPLYRIRSYPSDPELETLYARWKRGDIVIPKFQRGFIWKPTQSSRLIESFLMGLPVPGIFVFVEGGGSQEQLVIDGQQRLLSVFGFFDGKFPDGRDFRLTGVDERWEGKGYEDLDSPEKSTLLTSVLRVVNIEHLAVEQDSSSVYQIFERLNTGGMVLRPQEIRNSSYHGAFNDMLMDANKDPFWRKIFGTVQPDARMRDVELIARFLALLEGSQVYTKPMKKFISDYMARHQNELKTEEYSHIFLQTAKKVFDCLGGRPFHIRRGINVAVCDSVLVAFARAHEVPQDIVERYEKLKQNDKYVASTTASTTDVNIVQKRLALAYSCLFD